MQPEQFLTRGLQDMRIARVLSTALNAVDPASLVGQALRNVQLPPHRRCYLLGLGKAAESMTRSAARALGTYEAALVITKHRSLDPQPMTEILEAGHPIPDGRSLAAGRAALRFVGRLSSNDLLICLISGGGSALATAPVPGVTLEDLQALTKAALASGATIEDVNVLRRQLDEVKGGGLAAATNARIIGLILSDVMGDRLEAIASGPTTPNPTGAREAQEILKRFKMRVPASVETALRSARTGGSMVSGDRVINHVVGNAALAAASAAEQAQREGFLTQVLDSQLQGEARVVGMNLANKLAAECRTRSRPFCLLAAGETTVTLTTQGAGGRNQELALAAVDLLHGIHNCMLISLATDGNDGPTDAAGAVVTGTTRSRAADFGMLAADYLARHDAYPFFNALGDLLKPGYTGTNVNDLMIMFGL